MPIQISWWQKRLTRTLLDRQDLHRLLLVENFSFHKMPDYCWDQMWARNQVLLSHPTTWENTVSTFLSGVALPAVTVSYLSSALCAFWQGRAPPRMKCESIFQNFVALQLNHIRVASPLNIPKLVMFMQSIGWCSSSLQKGCERTPEAWANTKEARKRFFNKEELIFRIPVRFEKWETIITG